MILISESFQIKEIYYVIELAELQDVRHVSDSF
jgi:hypothetical protein